MARLRGRARRGERCRAAVPHGHWKTTTFTGALRLTGMTAPTVLDGPMHGAAFQAYIEQVLVPTLSRGDTVTELKAILRRAAARTIDQLWKVVGDAMDTFTPDECANYFTAAGYEPD